MALNTQDLVGDKSVIETIKGRLIRIFHGRDPLGEGGLLTKIFLPQLLPVALLVIYGTVVVWSASLTIADASFSRHVIGIAVGLVAAIFVWRYDYRGLANYTIPLLILDVLLILSPKIPGIGVEAKGMLGWVRVPILRFTFQPAELAKIITIIVVAGVAAEYNGKVETLKDYVKLCASVFVPFAAIMMQPDLGTALIVMVAGATIIICAGAPARWVLVTIGLIVGFAAAVVITSSMEGMPHLLKEYQLNRLIVFMDPSVDPTGVGYNLQQAKIAVGSGGIFGKGIGNATQSASGFLPEAHTDFVFALLAEEFGFMGAIALLALFAWMIYATLALAGRIESTFSRLMLVGVIAMWAFQLLQNIGMCIGIMPITGIPLPFISFGSTSMVVQLMAVGLVQSAWRHAVRHTL